MSHLLIQCEGETEYRIVKPFLQPYWSQRFSSAEVIRYEGNGDLKAQFATDAQLQLKTDPESSVLCLVDLYEEPFGLYQSGIMTSEEGFQIVQDRMYSLVDAKFHPRFGAFPVVMELETWLLADESIMRHLGHQPHPEPESENHPADYLKAIQRAKNNTYNKVIDGVNLFRRCSARRVYDDNCPHFKNLVDWLVESPITAPKQPDPYQEKRAEWERRRNVLQVVVEDCHHRLDYDPSDENLTACLDAENELNDYLKTIDQIYK